jgi:hypothetical protein
MQATNSALADLRSGAAPTLPGAMTAQEAIALLPEWQKRLRLMDWTIQADATDQRDECGGGKTNFHAKYKDARILILNPDKYLPEWLGSRDPEVTLVHELLHIQCERPRLRPSLSTPIAA